MNKVRCAIYTRKSSEEGLEQDFNSLHAQREACTAYILSQASEGWSLLPEEYNDGGLSGGTLERRALKRLLADVEAGKIDIVVVYKVDRLTRSLLDFSKLVEAFDKADTSFVSVTQSFNTTTSMGRLTLNMLLSFAQFEREVTAERIRDKIAASKAKGMWMGGICPLGYQPDGRTLAIVPEHAEIVRELFERYLEIANVRLLAQQLEARGILVPVRLTASGAALGGGTFKRGQLYAILANPTYVGEVHHKGNVYIGLHRPIIDRELWDRVQNTLADNRQGTRRAKSSPTSSALAGLVFDDEGAPLVATHACKDQVRYRYFVSKALHGGSATEGIRMSAPQLEKAVIETLTDVFEHPLVLAHDAGVRIDAASVTTLRTRCNEAVQMLRQNAVALVRRLVTQVRIADDRITVEVSTSALSAYFNIPTIENAPTYVKLQLRVQLRRSGKVFRLIDLERQLPVTPEPQAHLIRLLSLARAWWNEISRDGVNIAELAKRHTVDKTYISRVVRLNHLSPRIQENILQGNHPPSLDAKRLLGLRDIPLNWKAQEHLLLGT